MTGCYQSFLCQLLCMTVVCLLQPTPHAVHPSSSVTMDDVCLSCTSVMAMMTVETAVMKKRSPAVSEARKD